MFPYFLRNARRPDSPDINRVLHHSVVDQPVPSLKPPMTTETAPLEAHGVHVGKAGEDFHVLKNSVLFSFWKFVDEISYWIGPNDPGHWRFLALRFASALDLR